jgi:hypothetical protein
LASGLADRCRRDPRFDVRPEHGADSTRGDVTIAGRTAKKQQGSEWFSTGIIDRFWFIILAELIERFS